MFFRGTSGKCHELALSPHPRYPARTVVSSDLVAWSSEWLDYAPPDFTDASVLSQEDDRPDPRSIDWTRIASSEGTIVFDAQGRPLNPLGRTG